MASSVHCLEKFGPGGFVKASVCPLDWSNNDGGNGGGKYSGGNSHGGLRGSIMEQYLPEMMGGCGDGGRRLGYEFVGEWMTPPVSPDQGYNLQQGGIQEQIGGFGVRMGGYLGGQEVTCPSPSYPREMFPDKIVGAQMVTAKAVPLMSGGEWGQILDPYKGRGPDIPGVGGQARTVADGERVEYDSGILTPPHCQLDKWQFPRTTTRGRKPTDHNKMIKQLLASPSEEPAYKFVHPSSQLQHVKGSVAYHTGRRGASQRGSRRHLMEEKLTKPSGRGRGRGHRGGGSLEPYVLGHAGDHRQIDDPQGENITLKLLLETPYSPRGKTVRNNELEEYQQMVAEDEVQKLVDELKEQDRRSTATQNISNCANNCDTNFNNGWFDGKMYS